LPADCTCLLTDRSPVSGLPDHVMAGRLTAQPTAAGELGGHIDRPSPEWDDAAPIALTTVESMRFLLNIIWLVLCGFWMAIVYVIAGIIMCILIITIPFGIASFRIAGFALWPFGRTIVNKPGAGAPSFIGNVIWFLLAGLWLAIGHLVTGVLLMITIIGIPLGLADFKLIPVSLAPLGKDIVPLQDRYGIRTVS